MKTSNAASNKQSKIRLLADAVTPVLALVAGMGVTDFSLRIAQNQTDLPSVFGLLNFPPLLVAIVGLILAVVAATYILFTINRWLNSLSRRGQ